MLTCARSRLEIGISVGQDKAPELAEDLVQSDSSYQLHGDVVNVLLLANREYRNNVRMVEVGSRLSFALKPRNVPLTMEQMTREDLDCHTPSEGYLLSLVNDAHAAATNLSEDFKIAQAGAGSEILRGVFLHPLATASTLLDGQNHREQVPDILGKVGMLRGKLLYGRTLAAAVELGEFASQLLEGIPLGFCLVQNPVL